MKAHILTFVFISIFCFKNSYSQNHQLKSIKVDCGYIDTSRNVLSIQGILTDITDQPAEGVFVTLRNGNVVQNVVSDSLGKYQIVSSDYLSADAVLSITFYSFSKNIVLTELIPGAHIASKTIELPLGINSIQPLTDIRCGAPNFTILTVSSNIQGNPNWGMPTTLDIIRGMLPTAF